MLFRSDRVGIIQSGRMRELGTIDELRATEAPTWTLDVDADPALVAEQIAALPGVTATADDDGTLLVTTTPAAPGSEQAVLRRALELGAVREFSQFRPHLVDLFREVVTDDDAAEAERVAR